MAEDTVISRAIVAIIPDFSAFSGKADAEGTKAGRVAGEAFARAFAAAVGNMQVIDPKVAAKAGKAMEEGITKSLNKVKAEAAKAGDEVADKLTTGATKAAKGMADANRKGDPFAPVKRGAADTGNAVEKSLVEGATKAARAMEAANGRGDPFAPVVRNADAAGERVSDSFRRTGEKIGESLRPRNASGQFVPLERSADDSSGNIVRFFHRARDGIEGAFNRARRSADADLDRMEAKAKGSSGRMRGYFALAVGAVGVTQLAQGLMTTVEASADLGESINAMNVFLGEGADQFLEFGTDAANALGLTQAQLNAALVPTAALLKNAGLEGTDLASNLETLAERATDVGSVFNKDTNEVLMAFNSALRGEAEPARQFGVSLDQAAIEAQALSMGLMDVGGELTASAKTQAAYALLLQQTNVAAGDFAKTADSYPNLLKRVSASWTEASSAIGTGMLPGIISGLQGVMTELPNLQGAFTELGTGIGDVLSRLGPFLADLITSLAPIIGSLGPIIGGVLSALTGPLQAITAVLGPMMVALGPVFAEVGASIGDAFSELGPELTALGQAFGNLITAAQPLLEVVVAVVTPLAGAFLDVLVPAINIVALLLPSLIEAFVPLIDIIGPALRNLGDIFAIVFSQVLVNLIPVVVEVIATLVEAFLPLVPIISNLIHIFGTMFANVLIEMAPILGVMATAFGTILEAIVPLIPLLLNGLMKVMGDLMPILPVIADALGEVFTALADPELIESLVSILLSFLEILTDLLPVIIPLLPAIIDLVPALVDLAVPVASLLADFLALEPVLIAITAAFLAYKVQALATEGATMAMHAASIAMKVANTVGAAAQWAMNTAMSANPIMLVVIGLAALAAAVYLAYQKFEPFRNVVDSIGRFFRDTLWPILQDIGSFLGDVLGAAVEHVKDQFELFLAPIQALWGAFQSLLDGDIGGFFAGLGDAIMAQLTFITDMPLKILGLLGDLAPTIAGWIGSAFMWLVTNGASLLVEFGNWVMGLPGLILGWLGDFGSKLVGWFVDAFMWVSTALMEGLADFIVWWITLPLTLIELIGNFGYHLVTFLIGAFDWVVTNGPGILANIGSWLMALPGTIIGWLASFGGKLVGWATSAFGWVVSNGASVIGGLLTWVSELPGKIISGAGNLGGKLLTWLTSAFDWLVDNVPGAISRLTDWFAGLPETLLGAFTSALSSVGGAVADIAGKIWNGVKGFINEKLLDPIRNKTIDIGPWSAQPFSFVPELADGAIVNSATQVIVGEAGPEVVIPLTKPERAMELAEKSGLLAMIQGSAAPAAAAAIAAPAAMAGGAAPAVPVGVGVAADATAGTDSWFTDFAPQATEALSTFGETVWGAVNPSFLFLQTSILGVFLVLNDFLTAWPLQVWTLMLPNLLILSAMLLAHFNTLGANMRVSVDTTATSVQGRFAAMNTNVQSTFSAMASATQGTFNRMLAGLSSGATTGGASVVSALKAALDVGTVTVATTVGSYAKSLADNLNPLMRAIGKPEINLSAFARGGINDPRIVADGSNDVHVFGERGTHGEAYIPFNPALRDRSRAIASETVERLGGVSYFAQGGITGSVTGDTQGLNPEFLRRLQLWSGTVGQTYNVGSGYRSMEEQARLYAAWLAGVPGQALAAPPGASNHNFGLASDGNHWRNLHPEAFGLRYPMGFEPWHVEPNEAKAWRAMMPDSGWTGMEAMEPLPKPTDAGKLGALSAAGAAAMQYGYDQALEWASSQSVMGGGAGGLTPLGQGGTGAIVELGKAMNAAKGWEAYWPALNSLWQAESGWDPNAQNRTSTAYGIAQFLNSTWAGVGATKTSDPAGQIAAGLRYIEQRYGNPGGAWEAWNSRSPHWYGDGALFTGPTIAGVGEDGDEVLVPLQKPQRALQLAVDSGLMEVLDQERSNVSSRPARSGGGATAYDDGFMARSGDTYHIYGLDMAQVDARIRAMGSDVELVRH